MYCSSVQFSCSVMSDTVTPWSAACQASLSITNSRSLLKLMSIGLMMPSNHLILCHPFLLLPSIFPSIRVFSNKSVLSNRWPKYWSFSFSISPSSEYSGLISFKRTGWIFLKSKGLSRVFNTTVQKHQFGTRWWRSRWTWSTSLHGYIRNTPSDTGVHAEHQLRADRSIESRKIR